MTPQLNLNNIARAENKSGAGEAQDGDGGVGARVVADTTGKATGRFSLWKRGAFYPLAAFLLTIPAANWMIGHVGTCIPGGPCLIPVGFGFMAPSGVLMIGIALVLRDVVHERLGWQWALGAIVAGGALSGLVAPPALALASVAAFTLSELADLAVYAPLRARRLMLAVLASGVAGAFIDSAVFLHLAFGSLDYLPGQVIGKAWATLAALPVLFAMRRRVA